MIENGASEALVWPSLTEITMLPYVPTLAVAGVPESAPVAALKEAQAGLFCTLNEMLSPSVSLALGVKV